MNLTIRNKLFLGFGAILLISSAMGYYLIKGIILLKNTGTEKGGLCEISVSLREMQMHHYKWVDNLRNSVRDRKPFEGALDPTQCAFGKWYYSHKVKYPELTAKYQALEEPHRKMHLSGPAVVAALGRGEYREADRLSLEIRTKTLPELMLVYEPFVLGIVEVYNTVKAREQGAIKSRIYFSCVAMTTLIAAIILITLALNKNITLPLNQVVETAKRISEGNLSQLDIKIKNKDELGALADSFNKMLGELTKLVAQAEMLSNGIIGADAVEESLRNGQSLEQAVLCQGGAGDLEDSFCRLRGEMRKLTVQARRIATDDLHNKILDFRSPGEMGDAFYEMTCNLRELARIAEIMAEGNLTVNLERCDKLGNTVLKNAFCKMQDNLRSMVLQIQKVTNNIAQASEGLSQVTEQSTQNLSQVSNVVSQISASTSQVAQNAQVAANSGQKANAAAEAGKEMVSRLADRMKLMSASSNEISSCAVTLSQKAEKVTDIVSVIMKISDQTNLLSLNAAIEAARAGEAGKGFAVVADEVRKLAESAANSAEEIKKIIASMAESTRQTVDISQTGKKYAEEGMAVMKDMEQRFFEVAESVRMSADQISQIAAAAEETSASAEEVTASTEEQTAAVEEIAAQTTALANTAVGLKELVSKFKV